MNQQTEDQEFSRDLGFLEAFTIGVGTMLGAGVFVLPGIVAEAAGPASILSFAGGGLISLLAALSLSELATGMPKAGGSYYYINKGLGNAFGSLVGWGMWGGLMFATGFYMVGFGQYLTFFWGEIPVIGTAIGMTIILLGLNYRGVQETSYLQNFVVLALVGVILLFVAVGLFSVDFSSHETMNPEGWGAIMGTVATVFVTFIGFEVIATSAEEIKNPGWNLPLSMIASVLLPTVLYILVMLVVTGVIPEEYAANPVAYFEALRESEIPVADSAELFLGTFGALIMVVGAVLATISSANASILSAARVNYAMGNDRVLPRWLNEIHENFKTPYRSILTTGLIILILIALDTPINFLAEVAGFTFLVTYLLVHVAVFVMHRADPDWYHPDFYLSFPWYPLIPLLGTLASGGILVVMTFRNPWVAVVGGGLLLMGFLWWLVYARRTASGEHLVGEAIVRPAEREEEEKRPGPIVVPVSNPDSPPILLRFANASAAAREGAEIVVVNIISVPHQTALQQNLEFEEKRIEQQQKLLKNVRRLSEDIDANVRTRAILGRRVDRTLLNVLEKEEADQVVLGWKGERRKNFIFGSNLDHIIRKAPCEVSVVRSRHKTYSTVGVLAGPGINTPTAIKRGDEFAKHFSSDPLSVVRITGSPDPEENTIEEERAKIWNIAENQGVDPENLDIIVKPAEPNVPLPRHLINLTENIDLICVGATEKTRLEETLFGSVSETFARNTPSSVALVRKPPEKPRSLREAIGQWLTSEPDNNS